MTASRPLRLLLIEDSSEDERLLLHTLTQTGFEVRHHRVESAEEVRNALQAGNYWDLIISAYGMPDFEGLGTLELVRKLDRYIPFIFVSKTAMDEVGVQAMRRGANDYLMKDNLARLGPVVERELRGTTNRIQTLTTKVQYRAILDSALDAILVVEEAGYIQIFNKGAENAFGYTSSEVLGQHIGILLPGDAFDRLKLNPAKLAPEPKGNRVYESLYLILQGRHKNGRQVPLEASCSRARSNKTYTIVMRDISERLASEQALRESEERLRLLMDNIRDYAIIMLDTQGRVTTWNQGAAKLMGYDADEIIGQPIDRFYPSEDVPDGWLEARLDQAIAEGRSQVEGWQVRKNGSRFYAELTLSAARDASGALCGVVKITRDITEHRAMENELRRHRDELEARVAERTAELDQARRHAERLARSKSDFLANMSHEIRTPMNAVLGLAYMLEQQKLPEDSQDLARKIQQSGQTLLGIINDILDFSKIESGRIELEQAPFQLCDLLDNLATIMSATAADKPLELIITPPGCVDLILRGDALRLGQVLINLTGNAIKFTPEGLVEVRIERLQQTDSRILLRFSVIDTGIGIDPETQSKLFQPFSQADPSTTRRFGGSGLGLAICRRLVDLMGGRIGLNSALGKGSTFWFELEFDLMERQGGQPRNHGMRMQALIVDDNAIVRDALETTVASLGWLGQQAESGEQALRRVMENPELQGPNALVLLDWRMPNMDGIATANAIRDALPESKQPLIFIFSAHRREGILATEGANAVDAVLSKPIAPSPLYDAVIRSRSRRLGEDATRQPAALSEHQQLKDLRLLIVDDSDINREVARRIFTDEGAKVILANDGREALDWLVANPNAVDVVLMDVQMPVMDGHDATRMIRRTPEIAQLPIIALTAGALHEQETAAFEAGMNAFLSKPFDVPEAIALIRRLTRGKGNVPDRGAAASSRTEPRKQQETPSDAVMPETSSAPTDTGHDLPGLAVGQGMRIWRDATVYRRYLGQFAQDHLNAVQQISELDADAARRYAHKLKGAAENLALTEVAACAKRLELGLSESMDIRERSLATQALGDALDTAQTSIAIHASGEQTVTNISTSAMPLQIKAADGPKIAHSMREALVSFSRFDIIAAEAVLDSLTEKLPTDWLSEARHAAENFDSAAGSAAIRALAERLNVSIEEP